MTRPPAGMEEEFNAWYDEEHLPERLSIRGFRSAQRWVRGRTYLATYELDSAKVLSSREYLSCFRNPTPWSRRCLGRCVVFKRWACEQIEPGRANPRRRARALLFSLKEVRPTALLQYRRFAAESGATIHLYELSRTARDAWRRYQP
jgi:hypothetical protein